MIAANIPFRTIENEAFRKFLEKYCNRSVPSESTIRKNYVQQSYDDAMSKIREDIGESYVWISVDETTDVRGRYVANLIVGKLDPNSSSRAYLICTKQLEKTNKQTVANFVNNGLKVLYPNSIDENRVLLAYTDAAAYMVAAMQLLKVFYPALVHVTCLAHGINRIAEEVRSQFPMVNKLISTIKKVFLKAPTRVQAFQEQLPDVPLPPEPVLTRWGTWLKAAEYYNCHLHEIKSVVMQLEDGASTYITTAKKLLEDSSIPHDLAYIRAHFTFLVEIISKLERRGTPLYENIDLIQEVKDNIKNAPGEVGEKVRTKIDNVLKKNTGLQILYAAADILSGKGSDVDHPLVMQHTARLKFAPVTSVDVERSFSAYKLILSDKRQSFTMENIEKVLVVYCAANYGV